MEESIFRTQRKKLIVIGLFLLAIALAVGREDEPGMVAQIAEQEGVPSSAAATASQSVDPVADYTPAESRQDDDLASWYASAGANDPPADTAPEDKSHLINDTRPLVSTDPLIQPQGARQAGVQAGQQPPT